MLFFYKYLKKRSKVYKLKKELNIKFKKNLILSKDPFSYLF